MELSYYQLFPKIKLVAITTLNPAINLISIVYVSRIITLNDLTF